MHAHPSDTATYSCVAENAAGSDEAIFEVLVLGKKFACHMYN